MKKTYFIILLLLVFSLSAISLASDVDFAKYILTEEITSENPLTITKEFTYTGDETVLLGGLFSNNENSSGIYFRWVQEREGWFPVWRLQILSDLDILPNNYIDGSYGEFASITLANRISPSKDNDYRAVFSYENKEGLLTLALFDNTEGNELYSTYFNVNKTDKILYPVKDIVGNELEMKISYNNYFKKIGLPLAMKEDFRSHLIEFLEEEEEVKRKYGFQFDIEDTIGMLLDWPQEKVSGKIRVSNVNEEEKIVLSELEWSPEALEVKFNSEHIFAGDSELLIKYIDGNHLVEIKRERLRKIYNAISLQYNNIGRRLVWEKGSQWLEFNRVKGEISLVSDKTSDYPLNLEIKGQYIIKNDEGEEIARKSIDVLEKTIDSFTAGELVKIPIEVNVPDQSGELTLSAFIDEIPGIYLLASERRFNIIPKVDPLKAPGIGIEMVHDNLRQEIGWPAILEVGEKYPSFKIYNTAYAGVLTAKIIYQDEVIDEITPEKFKAAAKGEIQINSSPPGEGLYKIEFKYESTSQPVFYDSFYFTIQDPAKLPAGVSQIAYIGSDGKMVYVPDYKGNRIPDYSQVGYKHGEVGIPEVPVKVVVEPKEGTADDSMRIQDALDKVAAMPRDENGFRGAVLLKAGEYRVSRTLFMRSSGVVLRGEGRDEDGTVIIATARRQYTLIRIQGSGSIVELGNTRTRIIDNYVPVGTRTFYVEEPSPYNVGDKIIVYRPATQNWINDLGMGPGGILDVPDKVIWEPSEYGLKFERKITSIEGNKITIDIPIMNNMEIQYGSGEIYRYRFPMRIEQVGIENLKLVSEFDETIRSTNHLDGTYFSDESHAWNGIRIDNAVDSWVREVTAKHFGYSAVSTGRGAIRITIENSSYLEGVSEIKGGTRYAFNIAGQQNLVKDSYSYKARHDYVLPSRVPGPNVFYNSVAENSFAGSEPHHRWSTGILFDNITVEGPNGYLLAANRGTSGTGHGWSGANVVFWNTKSPLVIAMQPPTAQNYAIGVSGLFDEDDYRQVISHNTRWTNNVPGTNLKYEGVPFFGDAYFEYPTSAVTPESLYKVQLEERLFNR